MPRFKARLTRAAAVIAFVFAGAHGAVANTSDAARQVAGSHTTVVAQAAAPAATTAATDTLSPAGNDNAAGLPWWLWLVVALLALGLLLFFLNRKKTDPTITTRGTR